jgi:hypothetical protein
MRRTRGVGRAHSWRWDRTAAALALAGAALLASSCRPAGPPSTSPGAPLGEEPVVRVGIAVAVAEVQVSAPAAFEVVVPTTGQTVRAGAGEVWTFTANAEGQVEGRGPGGRRVGPVPGLLRVQVPGGKEPVLIGGQPYRGGALLRGAGNGRVSAFNIVDVEA